MAYPLSINALKTNIPFKFKPANMNLFQRLFCKKKVVDKKKNNNITSNGSYVASYQPRSDNNPEPIPIMQNITDSDSQLMDFPVNTENTFSGFGGGDFGGAGSSGSWSDSSSSDSGSCDSGSYDTGSIDSSSLD